MLDSETKRHIDNARDILVGKVPDPKSQVEQITFAMIYKFMDDMDQLSVSIGGNPSFFSNGYEQFAWSKLMDKRLGGEARLDLYVRALDQMSQNPYIPQLFRDVFKGAFLPYRDSETLNLFLKEINSFTYTHSEDLGDAYEYLLSVFGSQGKAGQFRTPRHIIDFIVDCVNPGKDDTVLDPACGTAGFLVSAYKHILQAHTQKPLSPDEKKRLTGNFVGYDISPDMVRLSRVNMYLHQFPNPTIHEYDTLTTEDRWDDAFDVILANPPFMSPSGGIRPHNRFAVRANRSEVLFVDYIAEHLNVGGRAGVIVPEGIIFQSSNAYKALRKMLVEENYLVAVVSLPAGVFNPYSGVKTSILLLDKALARRSESVLFLKVAADGYGLGAQRREIEPNDLPEALRVVKAFQADPSATPENAAIAQVVKKASLAEGGDYNLSKDRYVQNDIVTTNWSMVELGDVLEYEQPTNYIVESVNYDDSYKTPVLTPGKTFILGYTNEEEGIYKNELPVIIFDDFTTASRLVDFHFKVKSSAMKILHAKKDRVDIKYAFYMIQNIQFNSSTHKRYWISEYSKIKIPLPPLEVQREIVEEIEGYQKVIDGARQVVENYKPVIPIDSSWPMVRLGDVCETTSGGTPLKSMTRYYEGGMIPWLRSGEVRQGYITKSKAFITAEGLKNSSAKIIPVNSVLIAMYGATAGQVGILKFESATNQAICAILPNLNFIPEFLYYFLISKTRYLVSVSNGGAQPNISQKIIKELLIPMPEISVQQSIATNLQNVQELINANRLIIQKFDSMISQRIRTLWIEV
ncbi:MAG: N-6 DNA methylase [Anaerolineaceae bacterium]